MSSTTTTTTTADAYLRGDAARRHRDILRAEVLRLWAQAEPKLSCHAIARLLRTTPGTVVGIVHRAGAQRRPNPAASKKTVETRDAAAKPEERNGTGVPRETRRVPSLAELVPLPSLGQTP